MSSDESISADGSSDVYISKNWETDLVGNFLLHLYHSSLLTSNDDWCVKKDLMNKKFEQYLNKKRRKKLKSLRIPPDIEALMYNCEFLKVTSSTSSLFKIKRESFYDFRQKKLNYLDRVQIINDVYEYIPKSGKRLNRKLKNNKEENDSKQILEYQGSTRQKRNEYFFPHSMCCFICQKDFYTTASFENHVHTHCDKTGFEFLNKLDTLETQFFTISNCLCMDSHNFCFEIQTSLQNVVIEKMIIVQSRSFYYVNNMSVPYKFPEDGVDRFFVDCNLFTMHLEQPIVIVSHLENDKDTLLIEQHHFVRSEKFPEVKFCVNPNRLPRKKLFKHIFELAHYFPPKEIQDALTEQSYHKSLKRTSNEFRDYIANGKKLQQQTMADSLNILLHIEDLDTIEKYLKIKQKHIKLCEFGDEYSFQLKSKDRVIVENILSRYDEVVITRTDIFTHDDKLMPLMLQNNSDIDHIFKNSFVGRIQTINAGRINFISDSNIDINVSYAVIFRPSRLILRYQYRALELLSANIEFLKKFLFPAELPPLPLPSRSISLYNTSINEEQLQAVRNIAEGPRNDATYIIFGPPGTGKTTTLVESILQLLKKPNTKILVTASSNSACDEVALKLCKFLPDLDIERCLVRIYSQSNEIRIESIDEELLENSNMYDGQFYPDIEILHKYRVVVCTLSVVGRLATGKFGRHYNGEGIYTHLFIDEVAASMETVALIGITSILTSKSSLIIAGDHKQLGPVLKSTRAKELGLNASLMDRLLARDCYRVDVETGDYDRTIQTRLIRNYRSHPEIVKLYSGLYYNNTLEPCAKKENVSLCEVWHKLPNKQYPILFHAHYGTSKGDPNSHSLCNLNEINIVMEYVMDLMYFGINGQPVKESDIGIISPYKKQYQQIKEELNLRKWFGIDTGSVEKFQGKEKNIIIVSFVRSGTGHLGFLNSPRRLNVTLSRAKCILILIGNPTTLILNKDFEFVINECKRNNTFVGSTRPPKKKEPSTVTNSQEIEWQQNIYFSEDRNDKSSHELADLVVLSTEENSEEDNNRVTNIWD